MVLEAERSMIKAPDDSMSGEGSVSASLTQKKQPPTGL
jgi:hypothetical protein